jgi:hypothetical protein
VRLNQAGSFYIKRKERRYRLTYVFSCVVPTNLRIV